MNFVKMHGTGNDFVVIRAEGEEHDWSKLAIEICDRHFGVGSDGIILALPSRSADLRMRMFNPDGSEAEMCGNGIRCLTKFAIERGMVAPTDGAITIETLAGALRCAPSGNGSTVERVSVSMGAPRLNPTEIPVLADFDAPLLNASIELARGSFAVTCVSMGNPHAVHFTATPVNEFPLAVVGPEIEHHALFPHRVNFEIVNLLDRGRVRARVWERGAGETLACGTGACAIGVAAVLAGHSDRTTVVSLPGGVLEIDWDGVGEVFLSGPATEVYSGTWLGTGARTAEVMGAGAGH